MKDPAVLFYTSDFLSGVAFLNMEQRGQYITLLCEQHQHGAIPENHMIFVCGSHDSPVIKKFVKDSDGNYFNERMREESEKRKKYCDSRSNNKSGRKPIKSYDLSHDNDMNNHMGNHMGNENENENINKDVNKNKSESEKEKTLIRKEKFKESLKEYQNKWPASMIDKFFDYWSEINRSGSKMRWELEPVFEVQRRLSTWAARDNNINKKTEARTVTEARNYE